MSRLATFLTIGMMLGIPVAATAQDDHATHHPQGDQATAPPDAQGKEGGMAMMKMDRQMEKMRDLMKRIHATQDPQERQRLMQEHMQAMQEGMKMMRGMGMMGGMSAMGMMGRKKSAAVGSDEHQHGEAAPGSRAEEDEDAAPAMGDDKAGKGDADMMGGGMMGGHMMMGMMKMHKMMMKRMDMVQSMMEQMLEHEAVEQEMEGKH